MKYTLTITLDIEQVDVNRKAPDPESVAMAFRHLIESGMLREYINGCAWDKLHNDDSFARIDVECQSI